MKTIQIVAVVAVILGSGLVLRTALGQQPGITRTDLQKHDLSVPGREVIQVRVDFAPGAAFPKHTHPGEEIVYVTDGSLEYQIEGKPTSTVKGGQAVFIPAGTVHAVRNASNSTASELATYVVEKGKPLVAWVK